MKRGHLKTLPIILSLGVALCVVSPSRGQDAGSTPSSTDDDRIQKLEDAVRRLSDQNQELRQEIGELKSSKTVNATRCRASRVKAWATISSVASVP